MPYVQHLDSSSQNPLVYYGIGSERLPRDAPAGASEAGSAPLTGFLAEEATERQELSVVLGLLASLAPLAVEASWFLQIL